MSGSLIKIDEEIVTSAVASVTLTGIDSTYDVYKVVLNNIQPTSDNRNLFYRVTKSGSPQSDSEYDNAGKSLRTASSFFDSSGTNATSVSFAFSLGNNTGEKTNAVLYLFNFANASEYSFATVESNFLDVTPELLGYQGGIVHTVASASDGVNFTLESSDNFQSGTFTLYGLKK